MKRDLIIVVSTMIITLSLSFILLFSMKNAEAELVVGDANGMNPGVIEAYASTTAPEGYLLCNGQEISRTTYSDLYAKIGTTYGAGNGSTTFNVPNLNGRVPVGKDSGTFANLGSTGGTDSNTLSIVNIPSHNHTVTPTGTVSSTFTGQSTTTNSAGTHSHTLSAYFQSSDIFWAAPQANYYGLRGTEGYVTKTTSSAGAHTHTVTSKGTVSSTFTGKSATTSSTGSGSSFTNLQPYIVVNYIIKY